MYYDRHSVYNFELAHTTDILLEPIENKVVVNKLITTTTPSITEHRSDMGKVIKGDSNYMGKTIRYPYSKGIDLMFKEGKFTVIRLEDIICIEHNIDN
jgi:hypothetical protein